MNLSRGLLLAFALTIASRANAQNSADADKLFDKGKQLMAENKLAEACTAFEDSQRLAAATTTEMNLANCREKNAQLATAYDLFLQVAKELESKPESKKLREVALQRAGSLAPRLSKLTLIVPSASQIRGLEIQLDSRSIGATQWNQPIALDGGMYKLIARAEDRVEWTTTVAIAPSGDTKTIEVPTLADAKGPEKKKPVDPPSGSLELPIIFGVAALGLGGAALGFELWGRSIYSDAENEFDRDRQVDLWDQANTRHYVAQVAGVAALGCAAAAVVFFVTRDKPTESSSVAIVPVTSPTEVGITAFARW
jgi:hypothetical protein